MRNNIEKYYWSKWIKFPDPRKEDYLNAPFGCGLYQLRNITTEEFILFGVGKNCAYRMSSLVPKPYGAGTRNNKVKSNYVLESLRDIEYRTIAFTSESEMKEVEREIKQLNIHLFNT